MPDKRTMTIQAIMKNSGLNLFQALRMYDNLSEERREKEIKDARKKGVKFV